MTTVLSGSVVIQNRSGRTVDTYVGSGTNVSASTTNILQSAGRTTAVLRPASSTAYACNVFTGAEVGDELEVLLDTTNYSGGWFYLPTSETLLDGSTAGGFDRGLFLRKVSSNVWGRLV